MSRQIALPFFTREDYALVVNLYLINHYDTTEGFCMMPVTLTGPIVPAMDPPSTCECSHCLLPFHASELSDGYCDACHGLYFWECHDCHDRFDADEESTEVDGEPICESCRDDHYFTCTDCGDLQHNDRHHHNGNDGQVCESCYEDHWSYCDSCDDYVHEDDYHGEGRCNSCYEYEREEEDEASDEIPDYHHTGNMRKWGVKPKDRLYYGIELEFECHYGERSQAYYDTCEVFGRFGDVKQDGSLDNGFEVATAPATPEVHREMWGKFFDDLPSVHVEDTCGMHIHASRDGISDLTLGKLLVFYNRKHNRNFVVDQAGRDTIYHGDYYDDKQIVHGRGYNNPGGRYQAINTTNSATIEFRIFAGTTDRQTFFANFEFVMASISFCKQSGINDLSYKNFSKWVAERGKAYPALHKRLRQQGYIATRKPVKV